MERHSQPGLNPYKHGIYGLNIKAVGLGSGLAMNTLGADLYPHLGSYAYLLSECGLTLEKY